MTEWMQETIGIHFVRPWWLLGILAIPIFYFVRQKLKSGSSGWDAVMSPELLEALIPKRVQTSLRKLFDLFAAASLLLIFLALSGPTWEKLPQPVDRKDDEVVVVLDLSYSMYVQDIAPSRLVRAKQKLTDILRNRQEGYTALVAYAGDPHVVTPLTNDTDTILHLVSSLNPTIMPIRGSDVASALGLAVELLASSSQLGGRILLLTDGIERLGDVNAVELNGTPVTVVGIGTEFGGPIPLIGDDGQVSYFRDEDNNLVRPAMDRERLQVFANSTGGSYHDLTIDDKDVGQFFDGAWSGPVDTTRLEEREFDSWHDAGYLLLIPIAIFGLLGLRRGAIVCFLLVIVPPVHADWRDDLWVNKDKQGHNALLEGRYDEAEELFEDERWQAISKYRNQKYDEAAEMFSSDDSISSQFNLGNSLAKNGQFEDAIATYDKVLDRDPFHEDALFNRELIQQLLEELAELASQVPQDSQTAEGQPDQNQDATQGDEMQMDAMPGDSQQNQGNGQDGEDMDSEGTGDGEEDQQDEEQEGDEGSEETAENGDDASGESDAEREMSDAFERWLRRIPDEPGGLLVNKFRHETIERVRNGELDLNEERTSW